MNGYMEHSNNRISGHSLAVSFRNAGAPPDQYFKVKTGDDEVRLWNNGPRVRANLIQIS